jgi:N-acetylglutamate synthase
VLSLWSRTEGIGLNESDTAPEVAKFLLRNPDLSPVALSSDGAVVGAVLRGHDGRRATCTTWRWTSCIASAALRGLS